MVIWFAKLIGEVGITEVIMALPELPEAADPLEEEKMLPEESL
jgi:hypothetical protein